MYEYIKDNVASIRSRMEMAAAEAGRDISEITLVAATKTNPAEAVMAAIEAGVDACGENRVQEMVEKLGKNAYTGAPLHFIGHLQKNKVKQVVGTVDLIESVDSLELLELINKRAGELGICQKLLLEVNIGDEESKTGMTLEQLYDLLGRASDFSNISILGLMAIPPAQEDPAESMPYFEKMCNLYVDIRRKKYDNIKMDILSMGMSSDFEYAIKAGATMVRVGSAIFGPRNYNKG